MSLSRKCGGANRPYPRSCSTKT